MVIVAHLSEARGRALALAAVVVLLPPQLVLAQADAGSEGIASGEAVVDPPSTVADPSVGDGSSMPGGDTVSLASDGAAETPVPPAAESPETPTPAPGTDPPVDPVEAQEEENRLPPRDHFATRVGIRAGAVVYDVTGDVQLTGEPERLGIHGFGGTLAVDFVRFLTLGTDTEGSTWRVFVGPRLSARNAGVASTGSLTAISGFSTDGAGALPDLSITASAGIAIHEDRSQLARSLLLALELGVSASIGWRIDETTAIVIDAGIAGVIAWNFEAFVLGPFLLSYEVSWR